MIYLDKNKIKNLFMSISIKSKMKKDMKNTTDIVYVNKNNQRNNGCSKEPGTDNNQLFYNMECLDCGHSYKANGTDIWQRKCPKCQGGRP